MSSVCADSPNPLRWISVGFVFVVLFVFVPFVYNIKAVDVDPIISVIDTVSFVTSNTTGGVIIGWSIPSWNYTPNSGLRVFLGIPYAEPPVNMLRFSAPIPKVPWSPRVLNTTAFSPVCPQALDFLHTFSFPQSFNNTDEDCLYLNVYIPVLYNNTSTNYPVMVWFHGGAYRYGSGQEYDGRLLALQGVVVVTVNFRLGVLGFLSTDDDVASGNYGLLDQVQALRWVRDNIGYFHGDPAKVTIFGESSGGGSVSLHTFSKLSEGLFHAVVPQSGCALSPWAIYRPPHQVVTATRQLAQQLSCPQENSSSIVDCLRNKSVEELVKAKVSGPPMIATWAPRVDGHFIQALPEDILIENDFRGVPMLTGTVRNESADEAESIPNIALGFDRAYLNVLFEEWSFRYSDKAGIVADVVMCEYTDTNVSLARNRELFIELKSDYGYTAPHQRLAMGYSLNQINTWTYSFQYRSQNDPTPSWMGVYHAIELYYLFGVPFAKEVPCPWDCISIQPGYAHWTDKDKQMSKNIMEIWTNFAKSQNPNPIPGLTGELRTFDIQEKSYLLIKRNTAAKMNYKPGRMEFWNTKLPKLLKGETTVNAFCSDSSSLLVQYTLLTVLKILFIPVSIKYIFFEL